MEVEEDIHKNAILPFLWERHFVLFASINDLTIKTEMVNIVRKNLSVSLLPAVFWRKVFELFCE